jgi:hypothetical protein
MDLTFKNGFIAFLCIIGFYGFTYAVAAFRKHRKLEITFNDIILGVLPFAFLLGILGFVTDIHISDVKIAFAKATQQPIKLTLTALPYTPIDYERKDGKDDLERIVAEHPQALSFELGYRQYNVEIMKAYFRRLAPFARYVLFFDKEGELILI